MFVRTSHININEFDFPYRVFVRLFSSPMFLLLFLFLFACAGTSFDSELRQDAEMYFELPGGDKSSVFFVHVARKETERARGMMYKRRMAPDQAMLFVFEGMEERSFWMKNTYVSLDMLFIDDRGYVKTIISSVPPLTETPRNSVVPVKYVLELLAGESSRQGIVPGSKMVIENSKIDTKFPK
ncbi:MAG TPA: DUF192 domain-containing protein [Oligoflexia bacterium]|nr:DUF192 domain-containing protein [Oligoflexia bacterium]HMP48901.1 DUF192 domain-containing protein [Oligoflexia bacterium]